MNSYYNHSGECYFEEPKTVSEINEDLNAKAIVDEFKENIEDSRYTVKKPRVIVLGHVEKQD